MVLYQRMNIYVGDSVAVSKTKGVVEIVGELLLVGLPLTLIPLYQQESLSTALYCVCGSPYGLNPCETSHRLCVGSNLQNILLLHTLCSHSRL